jgi:threonine/homoserine/homoserine lactone efflux protein
MTFAEWLSLFLVCLMGAVSPGPSLAVVMKNTLGGGRGVGLACSVAHGLGVGLYALLTVAGLAVVVTQSPSVFVTIQLLGAIYLIHLGVKALRSNAQNSPHLDAKAPLPRHITGFMGIREGFAITFLNPKLAVFMLALFSQFLDSTTTWPTKGLMVMTAGVTDALWYSAVALMVSHPRVLVQLERRALLVDRILGSVLVLLGLVVIGRVVANTTI